MSNAYRLAATLALASGFSGIVACSRAPAEPTSSRAAPEGGAVAPVLDRQTRGWQLAKWYGYELKLTTAVSFGDRENAVAFELDGLVQLTPTAVTTEEVTLYLALANPRIASRDARSQAEFDKMAAQIGATGVFFSLSGGRVTDMRAPRGLSPTVANTYREIGSALQFVRTTEPTEHYAAEEYDTTGQYLADYQRVGDVWHKRKEKYLGILAAKSAPANVPGRVVPEINQSDGQIRLFPDGHPQSIELRNELTISGAQQPVHSTTLLSLTAARSEVAPKAGLDWNALMSGMDRTPADQPYGAAASIESLDRARINGLTFEQAVASFEQLGRQKQGVTSSVNGASLDAEEQGKREQSTAEEQRLFIGLSAIFREQPDTIGKAVQKIKTRSPASDVLIAALSAASSPAAQRALVELAASKGITQTQRDRIMAALSRTPRPDTKAIDALTATLRSDPFNETALLGLGTYSRRLRDAGNIEQANAIGELLIERLRAAPNSTDLLTGLRAITNSGYAPALPHLAPYLAHASDDIRVAAVRAVQSMNDAKVDDLLAERLASDPSSDVRVSALAAAKVRQPTDALVRAVEGAATAADDPHVRYRAVELLAVWLSRRDDVRGALERIAASDGEVRIRELAQSAL